MTEYSYGPWIKHDGKGMPVDGDTLVCVRWADGFASHWADNPVEARQWAHSNDEMWSSWRSGSVDDENCISEYRVVTEVKP